MGLCLEKFQDKGTGGFFDVEEDVLGIRIKAVEDVPHPSANSAGIMQLLRLYHITGKDAYYQYAEAALKSFSGETEDMGLHAGYYFCALEAYFHMLRLFIEAAPGSGLAEAARSFFRPYKSVVYGEDKGQVTPCQNGVCLEPLGTPEALRE